VLTSIRELTPAQSPLSPALARLRAVAGQCALLQGDRAMAQRMAALSRSAFAGQPQVSNWYRLPLAALEASLAARPR
jgi:hypothetical protein